MVDLVLKILVFSASLVYVPNVPIMRLDLIFFALGMIALFIASLFDKKVRNGDFTLIAFLVAMGAGSLFFSGFNPVSMSSFINLFLAVVGFVTVFSYAKDIESIKKIIVYSAFINIFFMILQKFGWNLIFNEGIVHGEEGGLMGNASRLSTYLAIALPFMVEAHPASLLLLFLIGAVEKEIGLLVVIAVYVCVKVYRRHFFFNVNNKVSFIYAFVILGGIFFFFRDVIIHVSLANRLSIWKPTIEQIFERPWCGFGLGNLPVITSEYHHVVNQKPDFIFSSYLQLIFGVGLVGAVWIVLVLKELRKRFDYSPWGFSALSIAILSFPKYPFEIHRCWTVIVTVLACFLIKTHKETQSCS